MLDLLGLVQEKMIKGQQTMHHTLRIYNGIWSDITIESTFMRYGHSKASIVWISLKPQNLKTWAYSLHICHSILNDLSDMRDNVSVATQLTYKEERAAIVQLDSVDRGNLFHEIELSINPLSPQLHPREGLNNVVTGEVFCQQLINVDKALDLGKAQMETFEYSLPGDFYNSITKVVNTIATVCKHI